MILPSLILIPPPPPGNNVSWSTLVIALIAAIITSLLPWGRLWRWCFFFILTLGGVCPCLLILGGVLYMWSAHVRDRICNPLTSVSPGKETAPAHHLLILLGGVPTQFKIHDSLTIDKYRLQSWHASALCLCDWDLDKYAPPSLPRPRFHDAAPAAATPAAVSTHIKCSSSDQDTVELSSAGHNTIVFSSGGREDIMSPSAGQEAEFSDHDAILSASAGCTAIESWCCTISCSVWHWWSE
jgi:hypothetical protein